MRCLPHLSLNLPPFPPSPLPSLGKHRNVKWAGEDLPSRPAASPSLPTHSPSRLPRPQLYLFTVALVSLHPTRSFLPSFAPPALIAPPIFSPPVLTRPPSAASPLSPSRSPSLVTSTFFLSVLS